MLPILIESELDGKVKEGERLIEAIRAELKDLIDESQPCDVALLQHLLREKRILVTIDHLSELSQESRVEIRPNNPDFMINALVVTTRIDAKLGDHDTVIRPMRVQGNRLSSFMDAYLTRIGKRDLFDDAEFFDACRHLSQLIRDRDITLLLAKMYAEHIATAKQGQWPMGASKLFRI
jgi:hypothetical protein